MFDEEYFDDYPPVDEEDFYGTAASAYDCTGLIPRGVKDEDELAAYDEIYPMSGVDGNE